MSELLTNNYSQFSEAVVHAATAGNLKSDSLIDTLDSAYQAASGVEVVLRMLQDNDVAKTDASEEPPLSGYVTGALTGLAIYAMQSLAADIERVSRWAENHGVREGSQ